MVPRKVLDWLLEDNQPAIRYRTLTELLGRPLNDPEVREAKERIPDVGWAAAILAERNPAGWWVRDWSHFTPTFTSTTWMMLVLSDLGLTRDLPEIRASCELWMRMKPVRYGPIFQPPIEPHMCATAIGTGALIRFGFGEDARVQRTLRWLVEFGHPQGGWSHFRGGRSLDGWQALAALAALPQSKRSASMQRAAELGAEFFLERELHHQGGRYAPWYRFHYPIHYYYDILVGLEIVTSLGYSGDPRLRYALALLREKQRKDGRWNLDALRPEVQGTNKSIPAALETPGAPSKMITLRALLVLDRVGS